VPVRGEMTVPGGLGLGLRFSAEIRRRFAAAE